MTNRQKRKWCKDVVNKWRSRLFLGEWYIDLTHSKNDIEMPSGGRPAAQCWADPVYMHATITIYPCFWLSEKSLRTHIIIHELAHCHTQSMWNVADSLRNGELVTSENIRAEIEQLTQRIANMVYQQEW